MLNNLHIPYVYRLNRQFLLIFKRGQGHKKRLEILCKKVDYEILPLTPSAAAATFWLQISENSIFHLLAASEFF